MRPTNVTRVDLRRGRLRRTAPRCSARRRPVICAACPAGRERHRGALRRLAERLRDEAPADGEAYRVNDRFFTDWTGPMTSLAPFVLGATPAGQVMVPAGADPFTIGYFAQLNTLSSGLPVRRARASR